MSPSSIALAILGSRWTGWIVALLLVIFYVAHGPKIETRTVTKVEKVVKWRDASALNTGPGATLEITRSPDGTEVIRTTGPVSFTRTSEGTAASTTHSETQTSPGLPRYSVGAAAFLSRPFIGVTPDRFQLDGGLHLGPFEPVVLVQWHRSLVPTGFGIGLRFHFR